MSVRMVWKSFLFIYAATTYVGHMGGVWMLYVAKQPWVLWDSLGVSGLKCLRAIVCVCSVSVSSSSLCVFSVCMLVSSRCWIGTVCC